MWQHQPPTAKIAIAVQDEWSCIPREEKVEQAVLVLQVRDQAVLGLPDRR